MLNHGVKDRQQLAHAGDQSDLWGLSRKVDDRIPSRLAAMCRVVAYKGTDRRLKR